MNVTPINKTIGYQLKALTVNADGSLLAQYSVGAIDESDNYKPLAEKNYMLSPADAVPILATPAEEGSGVYEQLSGALAAALSLREDWLA